MTRVSSAPDGADEGDAARSTGGVSARPATDADDEYPDADIASTLAMRELMVVGRLIDERVAEVFAEEGVSHQAGNVLAVIEGAGRPVSAGDIAAAVHVTSGSVTSVIDTLERKGLVRRFPDRADRRRVLVDITPAAEELLDRVLPRVHVRSRALAAGLTAEERTQLLGLLAKLVDSVAALDEPPDAPGGRNTPAHLRAPRDTEGRRVPPDGG